MKPSKPRPPPTVLCAGWAKTRCSSTPQAMPPPQTPATFLRQARLAAHPEHSLSVARALFAKRFPDADLEKKSLQEMMAWKVCASASLYEEKARQYNVGWKGRSFTPGKFELSDLTNQILTSANAALYGILCSCVHSLGYSPHLGFIHSGSPLPFIYDLADLYKAELCIDLAFSLTLSLAGSTINTPSPKHSANACWT